MTYQPLQPALRPGDRVLVVAANGQTTPATLLSVLVQQPLRANVRYDNGTQAQIFVNQLRPMPRRR